jgi:AraC-like DNA-binding protein
MNIFDNSDVIISKINNCEKICQPYGYDLQLSEYRGAFPRNPKGFYTLALVIDGECDYIFEKQKLRAKTGDIVFLDNYTPFRQVTLSDFYVYVINFVSECGLIKEPKIIKPLGFDKYLSMFKEAAIAFEQKKVGYILLTKSIIYRILSTIQADGASRNQPRTKGDKITFAKDYVSRNLANCQLSVQTIASEMNISTAYLRKIFVENVGMSPLKYIKTLRINLAADILSTTAKSVDEAARECGFQDTSYFCKEFKKTMGASPLSFRKKYHITTAPIKK